MNKESNINISQIFDSRNLIKSKTFKNFVQRMLLLAIGGGISLTAFHGYWVNFLFARVAFTIFIVLMGIEMHFLLPSNIRPRSVWISIFASLIFPIQRVIQPYTNIDISLISVLGLLLIFILYGVFTVFDAWDNIMYEILGAIFIAIYPGLLATFWLQIIDLPLSTIQLYAITATAYSNDGFGYLVGFSLGRIEKYKRKKPILTVSPGKTYTGYVGGMIAGMVVYIWIYAIEPLVFNNSLPKAIIFGILVNLVVILGDLFESAIKRNLGKKDSGTLMMGRGGLLDTFDSLLFAAPAYYILYTLFFL